MWPCLCPFWFVKRLNFEQNLPIWPAHDTFLESRHPVVVTKNPYSILSPKGGGKKWYEFID